MKKYVLALALSALATCGVYAQGSPSTEEVAPVTTISVSIIPGGTLYIDTGEGTGIVRSGDGVGSIVFPGVYQGGMGSQTDPFRCLGFTGTCVIIYFPPRR